MTSFDATVGARPRYRWLAKQLGCVLIALTASVRAETVPDLYAVSVPVAGQSQAELQRAAATGLREIAVRVTGSSTAPEAPALATLFAKAMSYLDQYRYERNAGSGAPWIARLRFSGVVVDNALRAAGQPVWGKNRPALEVWLALDDGGSRHFVTAGSPVAAALAAQLQRRGLLLHFPSAYGAVTVDDVWQLDVAKIRDSAGSAGPKRADGYLVGRMSQIPGGSWLGSWTLAIDGQQFGAEGDGDSLPDFLAPTFDRIVDQLSAQYAVAANSGAEGLVLRISGIANFDDYAAVTNYLSRLGLVDAVSPVLLRNDELLVQLKVEGTTAQLTRQLALESRLSPTAPPADAPLPVTLSYRWTATPLGTSTPQGMSAPQGTSTPQGAGTPN